MQNYNKSDGDIDEDKVFPFVIPLAERTRTSHFSSRASVYDQRS